MAERRPLELLAELAQERRDAAGRRLGRSLTLLKDSEHPEDGFYFIALNRYRTDLPGGVFGKMAVNVAADSARESTESYLTATKQAIEKSFRDQQAR